jgi:hypothetical protein
MKYINQIRNILVIILICNSGCVKEKFDSSKLDRSLTLKPAVALPIGYSHIGIEKFLKDASLKNELRISKDGFLSLDYSMQIASGSMDNLLSIQNSTFNKTVVNQAVTVIDLQTPGVSLDLSDSATFPVRLNETDARLDSISLLSGSLVISQTSINVSGTITYHFPGIVRNGAAFTITRIISDPAFSLPLDSYTIIPEHDGAGNNLLKCLISVHLQSPSGPVATGSPILNSQVNISSLKYNTIYGDFEGYGIVLAPITFSTGVFKQIAGGHFEFADPKLKLLFSNSIGVPLGISISAPDAIDRSGNHHLLAGPGIPDQANPKIINYPTLKQQGQVVRDSLILDKTNSNVRDIFSANPVSISIRPAAGIMPLPGTGTSFINHNSDYSVVAAIELPLWGKAVFMVLTDTMSFDYLNTSLPQPKELEKVIVRINITNSFPVAVYPQIYLLDENRMLLDSIFTGKETIEGAVDLNNDGIADPHKQDPVDIELSRSRIDNLFKTRFLVTKGKILTTNYPDEDVKFYSTYFLDYNVGVISQLNIDTGK